MDNLRTPQRTTSRHCHLLASIYNDSIVKFVLYRGRSASSNSGGKRGVSGASCAGACTCGGGSAVRLANEPLLSLVLTCLRHQDDQKARVLTCCNPSIIFIFRS